MKLQVEFFENSAGEAEPCTFYLKTQRIRIIEIIDRWLSPKHCYFKVKADDGGIYILRYEASDEQWELTMFQAMSHR